MNKGPPRCHSLLLFVFVMAVNSFVPTVTCVGVLIIITLLEDQEEEGQLFYRLCVLLAATWKSQM